MLEEALCEGVSSVYHPRLKEVAKVLECRKDFNIVRLSNSANVKSRALRFTKDNMGFQNHDNIILSLSGKVSFFPHFNIEGDFAVLLVRAVYLNPVLHNFHEDEEIIIYEKGNHNMVRTG